MTSRRSTLLASLALLATTWLLAVRFGLFRLRVAAGRLSVAVPDTLLPTHFSVLPPPPAEYVGIWAVEPETARQKLTAAFGFSQLFRAYLHGYSRDGQTVHEVGSYVYRPNGFFSHNQLHVRLFPTAEGYTEVWAHWEANPNRSPISHLKKIGYDTAEGERRLTAMLADEPLQKPDPENRPEFVQ